MSNPLFARTRNQDQSARHGQASKVDKAGDARAEHASNFSKCLQPRKSRDAAKEEKENMNLNFKMPLKSASRNLLGSAYGLTESTVVGSTCRLNRMAPTSTPEKPTKMKHTQKLLRLRSSILTLQPSAQQAMLTRYQPNRTFTKVL